MQDTRIHTGLVHRGIFTTVKCGKSLGPSTGLIVQVPVKGFGQVQALSFFKSQRMNVGQKHQQASQCLPAFDNAKLISLFDGVGGVATRIGQANDFGFGGLRLQQEGRKILGRQRVAHLTQHLAAVFQDHRLGITL